MIEDKTQQEVYIELLNARNMIRSAELMIDLKKVFSKKHTKYADKKLEEACGLVDEIIDRFYYFANCGDE